jgi:hypothetical protein
MNSRFIEGLSQGERPNTISSRLQYCNIAKLEHFGDCGLGAPVFQYDNKLMM